MSCLDKGSYNQPSELRNEYQRSEHRVVLMQLYGWLLIARGCKRSGFPALAEGNVYFKGIRNMRTGTEATVVGGELNWVWSGESLTERYDISVSLGSHTLWLEFRRGSRFKSR